MSQAGLVLSFRNSTGAPVSPYTRDAARAESFLTQLAAAEMQGKPTQPGEVRVARAGDEEALWPAE